MGIPADPLGWIIKTAGTGAVCHGQQVVRWPYWRFISPGKGGIGFGFLFLGKWRPGIIFIGLNPPAGTFSLGYYRGLAVSGGISAGIFGCMIRFSLVQWIQMLFFEGISDHFLSLPEWIFQNDEMAVLSLIFLFFQIILSKFFIGENVMIP